MSAAASTNAAPALGLPVEIADGLGTFGHRSRLLRAQPEPLVRHRTAEACRSPNGLDDAADLALVLLDRAELQVEQRPRAGTKSIESSLAAA